MTFPRKICDRTGNPSVYIAQQTRQIAGSDQFGRGLAVFSLWPLYLDLCVLCVKGFYNTKCTKLQTQSPQRK